jgi:CheY-like chemotaxis protein
MLQRLVGEDVEVCTDLGADLGMVRADSDQMSQILVNLTANARDAMPRGGRISIRTSNIASTPEGEGKAPSPMVLLEVSDTGVGMSTATLQNIFEPFFTTKERGRGTGLGLATVYGIVQQNGGEIKVTSSPGEGSTFSIYLPRFEGQMDLSKEPRARTPIRRSSETMLVVEDHEGVRSLIVGALALAGYRVLQAGSGAEALVQVQQYPHPIHMLITDVIMPGMTGKEVAGRVAELRPGIKVLYISGYSGEVIAHRGVLDAGVDYLPKPFTPDTLTAKVHEMLGPTKKGYGA